MTTQQENRPHNEKQLRLMEEGDLIQFDRGPFSHWGVYIGEGNVVHVTSSDDSGVSSSSNCGSERDKDKIVVKKDDFWEVAKDSKAFRNNSLDREMSPLPREQIVQRALSKLGKFGYDILSNNCEHFASWCRYGEKKSEQAHKITTKIKAITGKDAITGIDVMTGFAFVVAVTGGPGLVIGSLIGLGVATLMSYISTPKIKENASKQ